MNHPNIAIVHGLEQADDVHALVMELIEGDGLSERITCGAIPIDDAMFPAGLSRFSQIEEHGSGFTRACDEVNPPFAIRLHKIGRPTSRAESQRDISRRKSQQLAAN